MPLQFQALVQHFAVECAHHHESGLIVMDRSNDSLDAHVSNCVASYVTSHRLPLHPTIYYADSTTSHAIQISDLISGSHRRAIEGDSNMHDLDRTLAAIRRTDLSLAVPTRAAIGPTGLSSSEHVDCNPSRQLPTIVSA